MLVDINDVRAELERLYRKTEEMLAEEEDETLRAMHFGTLRRKIIRLRGGRIFCT